MFDLTPLTTENVIELIGIIATIITIVISVITAKRAVKNALFELKAENSLKEISSLPEIVNNFIESIKALIIYSCVYPNQTKHIEASQNFDLALPKLQNTLLMYGSGSSIEVFYELVSHLRFVVAGEKEIKIADLFSLLLLLYAQIRYDLTNEKISLDIYFDLLLPEVAMSKEAVLASAKFYNSKFNLRVKF